MNKETNPSNAVLLVDDDPEIVETLKFALSRNGYEVFIARNGNEALAMQKPKNQL